MRDERNGLCTQYVTALEQLPAESDLTVGSAALHAALPAATMAHADECASCKEATEVFWASRGLLRELRGAPKESPWFARRVMAMIAARELEAVRERGEWSSAVAKLASRLAWVSGLALLVASTWIYDARLKALAGQASSESAAAYLFDNSPAPANGDETLASLAERQP